MESNSPCLEPFPSKTNAAFHPLKKHKSSLIGALQKNLAQDFSSVFIIFPDGFPYLSTFWDDFWVTPVTKLVMAAGTQVAGGRGGGQGRGAHRVPWHRHGVGRSHRGGRAEGRAGRDAWRGVFFSRFWCSMQNGRVTRIMIDHDSEHDSYHD